MTQIPAPFFLKNGGFLILTLSSFVTFFVLVNAILLLCLTA